LDPLGEPLAAALLPTTLLGSALQDRAPARLSSRTSLHALVLPPLRTHNVPALREHVRGLGRLQRVISKRLNEGQPVLTLGSASWLVAGLTQAQGRRFAVPWFLCSGFAKDFPSASICEDSDLCSDGPFVSSGTPTALVPLLLALLARVVTRERLSLFEGALGFDPQRQRSTQRAAHDGHIAPTRDSLLARATSWLEEHLEDRYSLRALAAACHCSPRTLLRHFQQLLHQTPLGWLQRLRCKRAGVLLATTSDNIHTIALACGYADSAAFRRLFHRHMGCSPSRYRQTGAMRSPRKRWMVEQLT
jgi:transcriptional regulator GlxA family with amidase domain